MKKVIHFSAIALAATMVTAIVAQSALAQPGGRGRGGPPGGFGGGGTIGLLMNEQVREELGLVDDQVDELRAMGEEARDEMRSMFEGMRDLPEEERRAAFEGIREKMEAFREEMQEKTYKVLLPHQVDRLKQIAVQQSVQRGGISGALERGTLAEELDLSEEQLEKIREKAEEVQAELREKIAELRAKAQDDVLSVLTTEQRATYKKLVGEPFEMENRFGGNQGRRPGGDRGGERGGRDGNRRPE